MRHAIRPAAATCSAAPALLLLLHGTGDNEHGLLNAVGQLAPPDVVVVSLRAPLQAPFGGFRWFEGYSAAPEKVALEETVAASSDKVLSFIQTAPDIFGTDPQRVFLLGFSQGATMVWTTLLSRWARPALIAGGMALSGRLFPELLQKGTPLNSRLADAAQLKNLPIFASHGADDLVTVVAVGRENSRLFTSWMPHANFEYVEDPDCGHEISPLVASHVREWLKRYVSAEVKS